MQYSHGKLIPLHCCSSSLFTPNIFILRLLRGDSGDRGLTVSGKHKDIGKLRIV